MRVRTLFHAAATALLATALTTTPAFAGTGVSTICSDGSGGTEYPVLTTGGTLAVEVDGPRLYVCYSTAEPGTPGHVTGGMIAFELVPSSPDPGAYAGLYCLPDFATGAAPLCKTYALAQTEPDNVDVTTYPNYACAVYHNGICLVWIPAIKIVTGTATAPLVLVDTSGNTIGVTIPSQCVSVLVTCP